MRYPIIAISGKKGAGKSSLADLLEQYYLVRNMKVVRFKFADPLYEMQAACLPVLHKYGIVPASVTKDRDFFEVMGEEYGRRRKGSDVFAKILTKRVQGWLDLFRDTIVIVDDLRHENEFTALEGKAYLIRVACEEFVRRERCPAFGQYADTSSETGLDAYAAAGRFHFILRTDIFPPGDVLRWCIIKMGAVK